MLCPCTPISTPLLHLDCSGGGRQTPGGGLGGHLGALHPRPASQSSESSEPARVCERPLTTRPPWTGPCPGSGVARSGRSWREYARQPGECTPMVPGRAVSFGRREGLDLGCPGDPGRPKPGSEPQLGAGNRNSNPGRALARRRRRGNAAPKRDSDKGSGAHAADGGSGAALWAAGNRARPDWRRSRPGTHGRDLLDQEVLPPGPAAVFPSSPCSPSIRDRDRDAPLLCAPGASSFLTVSRLPGSFWRTPTLTFLPTPVTHLLPPLPQRALSPAPASGEEEWPRHSGPGGASCESEAAAPFSSTLATYCPSLFSTSPDPREARDQQDAARGGDASPGWRCTRFHPASPRSGCRSLRGVGGRAPTPSPGELRCLHSWKRGVPRPWPPSPQL